MDKRFKFGHQGLKGITKIYKSYCIIFEKNNNQEHVIRKEHNYVDALLYFHDKINRRNDCELIDIKIDNNEDDTFG